MAVPAAGSLRFPDPGGNNIEVVDYHDVKFTKAPAVLRGMSLEDLDKSDGPLEEPRVKSLVGE